MRVALAAQLVVALSVAACRRDAPEDSPEAVVREFIDRMGAVHGDPASARAAYDLVWEEARGNLAERARRASALVGRRVAPEEMVAPSWFTLKFQPARFESSIDGDWAIVVVSADRPEQHHEIRCKREDGAWRVALEVPHLTEVARRGDGG